MSKNFEKLVLEKLNSMQGQLDHLNDRFDNLEQKVDSLGERMDKLEQRMDRLEQRMDKLEQRMLLIEQRIGRLELRVDNIELKIEKIEQRLTAVELSVLNFDKNMKRYVESAAGYIGSELVRMNSLLEWAQELYEDYGTRISKNENQIELISSFVGYSTDNTSLVVKDAINPSEIKPGFLKKSTFSMEELMRRCSWKG